MHKIQCIRYNTQTCLFNETPPDFHTQEPRKKHQGRLWDEVWTAQGMHSYVQVQSWGKDEKEIKKGDVLQDGQVIKKSFNWFPFDLILTGEFRGGGQKHYYMETNSTFVIPKKEDEEMDIYVSTQDNTGVQVIERIVRNNLETIYRFQ